MSAPSNTTTPPVRTALDEEFRALRDTMAASGLDEAGHKRAAELVLATYGDEFTQFDLAAALVHATLAGNPTGAGEPLRKSVAYWQDAAIDLQRRVSEAEDTITRLRASLEDADEQAAQADARVDAMAVELEQARDAGERAERSASAVRAQLAEASARAEAATARADEAVLDRDRYRAQALAVGELCRTLRKEGHVGIARRIEGVVSDADTATARRLADAQRAAAKADPFAGLDADEPNFPAAAQPGQPHLSRLLAGECRCGGAIDRDHGDGQWRHTETGNSACRPGDPDSSTAAPATDRTEQGKEDSRG